MDLIPLSFLIERVHQNRTGIFDRNPRLVARIPQTIAEIIGSDAIYISEFILAKIKGKIHKFEGHPMITDEILLKIPKNLSYPFKILSDTRKKDRREYLFVSIEPLHQIVVEIERRSSGLSEINTIFDSTFQELKRLERKLPVVYSSGETPVSRMHAS